jgi:hypothetical protein
MSRKPRDDAGEQRGGSHPDGRKPDDGGFMNPNLILASVGSGTLKGLGVDENVAPQTSPPPKPKPERPEEAPGPDANMVELMARAQVAWLGAGMRYWGEMAELFGRRGANIADMARLSERDMDEREKLRLLDEARGYLREVGEISMREAQALTDDMMKLEAALRKTQAKPPAKDPKRHGRPT